MATNHNIFDWLSFIENVFSENTKAAFRCVNMVINTNKGDTYDCITKQ